MHSASVDVLIESRTKNQFSILYLMDKTQIKMDIYLKSHCLQPHKLSVLSSDGTESPISFRSAIKFSCGALPISSARLDSLWSTLINGWTENVAISVIDDVGTVVTIVDVSKFVWIADIMGTSSEVTVLRSDSASKISGLNGRSGII